MIHELNAISAVQQTLGGVSRTTVYNLIASGDLARVNLGRRAFITGTSLEALIGKIGAP